MLILRGGNYVLPVKYLRSACRYWDPSTSRNQANGLRVKLGEAISTQ